MRLLSLCILVLLLAGCGNYGYHPNYIISQDEEEQPESVPLR